MGERDVEPRRPRRGSREGGGDPDERSRAAFKGRSQERWGLQREWFVGMMQGQEKGLEWGPQNLLEMG